MAGKKEKRHRKMVGAPELSGILVYQAYCTFDIAIANVNRFNDHSSICTKYSWRTHTSICQRFPFLLI